MNTYTRMRRKEKQKRHKFTLTLFEHTKLMTRIKSLIFHPEDLKYMYVYITIFN